jgi:hypothetical protein
MKVETYNTACDLMNRINDYDCAISKIEREQNGSNKAFNFTLCHGDDEDNFKKNTLGYLKKERSKLQKQFDNLK